MVETLFREGVVQKAETSERSPNVSQVLITQGELLHLGTLTLCDAKQAGGDPELATGAHTGPFTE